MSAIVSSDDPIAVIGGGETHTVDVAWARGYADLLVAADGGADRALDLGWMPDAVIGDFDSVSATARSEIGPDRLFPISEQDSTDFDKCLRSIEAPLILGLGFTGRRIDHTVAAFSTLCLRPDKRCILLSSEEVIFVAPRHLVLELSEGMAFSLYPMALVAGRSQGLVWPVDGITMQPDGRVGTSNRVDQGGRVELWYDAPKMLVMLPRDAADAAVAGLMAAERWG
ncbi:thiamine diphosphokinase [Donghicola sp. C2-DW-16]|uniref:Thiamine diphosphokinase n=1 Tax=Donghicola mangrovi TaxID=2729614 RepID=A0ABX2PD67_9RHOB|nr:thiamine diphosphokinase [Donghicola mangrovi]NVO27076.1 thiamine diphosphokinase [Donghicola mangrovi]